MATSHILGQTQDWIHRAWEVTLLVKYLPCKSGNLSSIPITHSLKKPSMVVIHARNPSAKEAETEDPWSTLAIQTYLGVVEWAEVWLRGITGLWWALFVEVLLNILCSVYTFCIHCSVSPCRIPGVVLFPPAC